MIIRRFAIAASFIATSFAFPQVARAVGPGVQTTGPDVTINRILFGASHNYGASDGYRGYSVGTTSCNIGTVPLNWCNTVPNGCGGGTLRQEQHPVIAQGIYRLAGGRLEQIGMSWLKHGFLSTNSEEAPCIGSGPAECTQPPLGGDQLGVGCTDTYGASLNGSRPLGMRSEVNPTTASFVYPYTNAGTSEVYDQRVKVLESDVDPTQNAGAVYFAEAQYVSDNDAGAGNGTNNASYQSISIGASSPFNLSTTGSIVRERSAIHAWAASDATVSVYNADVTGGAIVERFEVARKVTDLGGGNWHYEYAIRNMNSDRSANTFTVDFADGTAITNVGFNDIEHHSGEPYSTADWDSSATQATGVVTWGTASHGSDPNANALRWATMFNFWFDAAAAPGGELHSLGLFKPGTPTSVSWQWPLFNDGFEAHNFVAWSAIAP